MVKTRGIFITVATLLITAVITGCANRSIGPQGGPRDSIPPSAVKMVPSDRSTGFNGRKIDLYFDEYIQLDNIAENMMISPPQLHQPEVKLVGKHVMIQFKDSLLPQTTYTIDFGRAICDFREKNPIDGFTYCFSTGDQIDSLEVYGRVVNAENLNPVLGVVVGIQPNLEDSAFETEPFLRIAKTDSAGLFGIRNIHEGSYRIYALRDNSRDYRYQRGEPLATMEEVIKPTIRYAERQDTLWKMAEDSTQVIDTIRTVQESYMEPGDLVLWLYEEDLHRIYMQRATRDTRQQISITFSASQDSLPTLEADWLDSALVVMSPRADSVNIWLRDSVLLMRDSLQLLVHYHKTDSLFRLQPTTDTVWAVYRAPKLSAKMQEEANRREATRKLQIKANGGAQFGIRDTLRLRMDSPVEWIERDSIRLYERKDTVYTPLSYELVASDSSRMVYEVRYPFEPTHQYELRIDSAAMRDIYGHACDKNKVQLKVRSAEEYTSLTIKSPDTGERLVLQLLDEQDKVIRTAPQTSEGVRFTYLEAKNYYLRLFVDWDGDGKWTTGSWQEKRHPEPVYYFPKRLHLRANWDFEEQFDYREVPQLDSKPDAIWKCETNKKK